VGVTVERQGAGKNREKEEMNGTGSTPRVQIVNDANYRDTYANSVQIRVSVWDFHLVFGQASSENPEQVSILNQQGIYLSPQQAKALWNVLGQNLAQYEQAFGELNLEPRVPDFPQGAVN
jgi:hypothetical protein